MYGTKTVKENVVVDSGQVFCKIYCYAFAASIYITFSIVGTFPTWIAVSWSQREEVVFGREEASQEELWARETGEHQQHKAYIRLLPW